jgi:4-hydroxy-2-oxoheptanedioate aldolase
MRANRVKRQLRAGEASLGTWLSLGSPLAAEQLTQAGFDWLNIEQEHGAIDATLTQSLLQAISIAPDVVPLIRVPWNEGAYIKRALDAGAYGLVIPMVSSREEAEWAVRWSKYPPRGVRSIGGLRTRLYGGDDYVEHANDELLVIIQIEHADGVRNARDILSVPGIDAYFIGPNDLCASMGLQPSLEPNDPRFWEALEEVQRAARDVGVAPGIHVASAERAAYMIDRGYQFISMASDAGFMASAAMTAVRTARTGGTAAPVALAAVTDRQGY